MLAFPLLGTFLPAQISIAWARNSRPMIDDVERLIERAWSAALARPGVALFDGPMCRLERFDVESDRLRLTLSRTSYKPFFGTNLSNAAVVAEKHGPHVLANAVGVSAALISGDGFLLLGRRTASVAYYPNRIHPFAGSLEPRDDLDVFDEVRRELREELSFTPADVSEIICTGIAEDLSLLQPEMIFAVRSPRTRAQIESHLDAREHHGIWSCPATRQRIESALQSAAAAAFTPVAIAAILLWGRQQFGDAWFGANRRVRGYDVPAESSEKR
jgi:hypothetical protein